MAYGKYLKQDYRLKSPDMCVFHVKKSAKKNCKIEIVMLHKEFCTYGVRQGIQI